MGKIRVKTIGDEEQEKKDKEKREQKRLAKVAQEKASGQKVKEESASKDASSEPEVEVKSLPQQSEQQTEEKEAPKERKQIKKKFEEKAFHSSKYGDLAAKVDPSKTYSLSDALELLEKLQRGKFDETVELHINTTQTGITGSITLPHGTGKLTRVAIATDALLAEVEKGKITFDILVATPDMMPKLAKVARILGPRGLMPNPKNGTVTPNPAEVAKKYEGGQVNFKTEAKSPIMHLTVGKMSFGSSKLTANIEAMIAAVKKANIVNVTLKSTMSPGIKIRV